MSYKNLIWPRIARNTLRNYRAASNSASPPARTMVTDPELIIFDEPTSALDPLMTREVGMLIKQLHDNGVTILCVTHDIRLARLLSDNVTFLNHGKIRAEGAFTDLALRETDPDIHCF